MNKSFRIVGLVMAALFLMVVAAEAQHRIATVELTQVFEKYWKTKRARLALADRKADLKKDLEQMQENHKKLVQAYQKQLADANDQAVSPEEREKRKKALEGKVKEIRESEETVKQFVGRGDAELEQQMKRMMDDVIKDIREAVAAKGKAGGYTYVLDSSAESLSKAPMLLYSSGESDLTQVVIEQLNAAAPPEPVGGSEKAAEKKP
ncbi:MAG TPA: OmpH family outer membrane protein [Verrucomicrobiae bacterium]|nr:OmpH family outer membrane protein [Verrucomicrobiae bacterium]